MQLFGVGSAIIVAVAIVRCCLLDCIANTVAIVVVSDDVPTLLVRPLSPEMLAAEIVYVPLAAATTGTVTKQLAADPTEPPLMAMLPLPAAAVSVPLHVLEVEPDPTTSPDGSVSV